MICHGPFQDIGFTAWARLPGHLLGSSRDREAKFSEVAAS